MFKKATKKQSKMRVLLEGASGSGKTYSALTLASSISDKIAVIDTERGSASLYSDKFDFDVLELEPPFSPEKYINAIKEAEKAGYEVILIDSITHEWKGEGGCLDIVSKMNAKNSYTAWKSVTPRHDKFVNTMLGSKCHIITTCRSKTEYALVENEKGKKAPIKQGTSAEQRDGLDYEMTIVFSLNENNLATATKDRTSIFIGIPEVITKETGEKLISWLNDGEAVDQVKQQIRNARSMDELMPIWKFLSGEDQDKYKQDFSNKKEQLTNG